MPYLFPHLPAKWLCFHGACLCLLWRAMAEPFLLRRDLAQKSGWVFSPCLEFWDFSSLLPTCSPCCSFAGWLCAPGPVLRQTWLIERESCSLLISSDSSALPEVGVPPRAESFHGEITAPSRKTQNEPWIPGQHARGARWISWTLKKRETRFVCFTTSGRREMPKCSLNLTSKIPFDSQLEV